MVCADTSLIMTMKIFELETCWCIMVSSYESPGPGLVEQWDVSHHSTLRTTDSEIHNHRIINTADSCDEEEKHHETLTDDWCCVTKYVLGNDSSSELMTQDCVIFFVSNNTKISTISTHHPDSNDVPLLDIKLLNPVFCVHIEEKKVNQVLKT